MHRRGSLTGVLDSCDLVYHRSWYMLIDGKMVGHMLAVVKLEAEMSPIRRSRNLQQSRCLALGEYSMLITALSDNSTGAWSKLWSSINAPVQPSLKHTSVLSEFNKLIDMSLYCLFRVLQWTRGYSTTPSSRKKSSRTGILAMQ